MRCVSENHHLPLPSNTLHQHLYIFSSGGDIEVKWWGEIPRPSGWYIEFKWWGKLQGQVVGISRSTGGGNYQGQVVGISRSSSGDI
jgi:hypothetical protein